MKLPTLRLNLSPKQRKIATWVGVPLSYFVCLFVFVRLTFPYDTLKERILSEFNAAEKERTLSIDDLSGSGFFGVEAEGVTLQDGPATLGSPAEPASDAGEAEAGDAPAPDGTAAEETPKDEAKAKGKSKGKGKTQRAALHFDTIDVGVSLLSYVIGNLNVSFDAEVGGGTIEGSYFQNDQVAKVSIDGEAVDISELTLLGKAVGLPLGGALTGHVELELPERSMSKAIGAIEVTISELTVGDGKAKVRNTIALPRLDAGTLNLKAKATDGKLDLETFGADGPDFEMTSEGKVRLRQPFDKSLADIEVAFRFKDAYKNKSDMTKSLFGSSDSKVPGLFDMDPTVRRAKDAEGFYRWKVTGLITSPAFRPATIVAARRGKDAAAGRAKADKDEEKPDEE
jgi:type II secretion system protein N